MESELSLILVVVMVCGLTRLSTSSDFSTIDIEGGTQIVTNENSVYGNNVSLRFAYLPAGARKAWLDYEHVLPSGVLEAFFFYIHNIPAASGKSKVMIQIWRPTNESHTYTLVWQRAVAVSLNYTQGALYKIRLTDQDPFTTEQGDRIGWTNTDELGPLSFDYVDNYKTYFSNPLSDGSVDYTVGRHYEFDNIHLPAVYSIAVQIKDRSSSSASSLNAKASIFGLTLTWMALLLIYS